MQVKNKTVKFYFKQQQAPENHSKRPNPKNTWFNIQTIKYIILKIVAETAVSVKCSEIELELHFYLLSSRAARTY